MLPFPCGLARPVRPDDGSARGFGAGKERVTQASTEAIASTTRRDLKAMGLIGLAHGCSHFFQLVLPPLFPFLIAEFGVGYTELGVMMTAFFVSSGLGQPLSGFLVDRFGARRVLMMGLGLYCAGVLLFAVLPSFWLFLPAVVLAGLGNSVFHPADFTILNATVTPARLGRAFGIHTFGGNLGWAAAPVPMVTLASLYGWRMAVVAAFLAGAFVLALIVSQRRDLRDRPRDAGGAAAAAPDGGGLAPLISTPVVLCFVYFLLLALALIAVQNFLPVTLGALYATPLTLANKALTGFLLGASGGVLVGGLLADRSGRHAPIIAGGLAAAALVFVVLGGVDMPAALLVGAVATAGFLSGVTTPSRDMLVRAASPPEATGRVFGFVYSGLDAGSALAPAIVGLMLDRGHPAWVLWLVAGMLFAAIFTAVSIRGSAPPRAP